MPSEWLGVHGGRSYGPSPRGSSLPGPAVVFFYNFFSRNSKATAGTVLIQENRKMPSEWLGVHGGRSYGPVSRGKSTTRSSCT